MYTFFKIISESILQALSQLTSNKLRSFLSLLGITIGIFCIVAVKTAVDSLENNVRGSFEKLGDDVVYISQFSWMEDPGQNFWKWRKRPNPDFDDYEVLKAKLRTTQLVSFHVFVGMKTLKYRSSSVDPVFVVGITPEYGEMFNFKFEKGRYFSSAESHYGSDKCVIGYKVAEELFGSIEPVGKRVKFSGRNLEVIGVLEKNGNDLVSVMDFDQAMMIPYELASKTNNLKNTRRFGNSMLSVKAREGIELEDMRDEITGVLRAHRRLKPTQEDNFAMNQLSFLSKILDGFFGVLNLVGLIIGGFAILVGIFSVANIMFVSVKERTNIIGIKKALGAKRYVILLEFLIESVILCILGGIFGLLLVFIVMLGLSQAAEFEMSLTLSNIIFGVGLSIVVGTLSGLIPAFLAAKMDPVEAIRK